MKWTYLLAMICVSGLGFSAEPEEFRSVEEKIKRLEADAGLDVRPETTTFFVFGEFIYWKASLDGVGYATTAEVVANPGGGTLNNDFKTRMVHFNYEPAFEIGLGIGLPFDHWDLTARWLRSHSTGRDTAHGAPTDSIGNRVILDSVGLIEMLDSFPTRAKAKCNVNLDVVDGVLGRTFLWSRYFVFRPYAGIRGAWVKLDWDISFKRHISTPSAENQSYTKFDVDNDFIACGFIGGFESKWNLYNNFGLYSDASAALLYGNSSEKSKQKFYRIPAGETEVFEQKLSARNSAHTVKAVFDIGIGLKWETNMFKNGHFLIWAGYDFFYWPNVTQKTITQANRSRDRADLSYQGFVVGTRFVF